MPRYDYQCDTCGKTFEVSQSIKDDPLTVCVCEQQSSEIRRLISASAGGFILKGSGFYNTDYKNAKPAEKAQEGSAEKDSGKSESKPAESTEKTAAAKDTSSKSEAAPTSKKDST